MRVIRFLADDNHIYLGEPAQGESAIVLQEPDHEPGAEDIAQTMVQLRDRHALVADDDEIMRKLITAVLNIAGCRCTVCADGAEAMQAIERESFDFVVTDILMPHHNGYEIYSAARARQNGLPILFITGFGYDPNHTLVKMARVGHETVLYKPFTPEELRREISKAVLESMRLKERFLRTNQHRTVQRLLTPLQPGHFVWIDANTDQLSWQSLTPKAIYGPEEPVYEAEHPQSASLFFQGGLAAIVRHQMKEVDEDHVLSHLYGFTLAGLGYFSDPSEQSTPEFISLGPELITPEHFESRRSFTITSRINILPPDPLTIPDVVKFVSKLIAQLSQDTIIEPMTAIVLGPSRLCRSHTSHPVTLEQAGYVSVQAPVIGSLINPIEMK